MADAPRTYVAPAGTVVSTSVDPMGLEVLMEFGDEGRYSTNDPGLLDVLDKLADNPSTVVKREAAAKAKKG